MKQIVKSVTLAVIGIGIVWLGLLTYRRIVAAKQVVLIRREILRENPRVLELFSMLSSRMQQDVVASFLKDPDPNTRANAYQLMVVAKVKWTPWAFQAGLRDNDPTVRFHAALAAGELRVVECAEDISAAYLSENTWYCKLEYVRTLVRLDRFDRRKFPNQGATEHEAWLLRYADFLTKGEPPDLLVGAIEHASKDTRCFAANLISYFADPRGLPLLEKLAQDQDENVRNCATKALDRYSRREQVLANE